MPYPTAQASCSRRSLLQGFSGLLFGGLAFAQPGSLLGQTSKPDAAGRKSPRASACILIWLDGGPSHLDLFDPKPQAPVEIRGPFKTIASSVPGLQLGECLPKLAERADRVALVRSVTSPLGEHNLGAHYLLTGYQPSPALVYPSLGSLASAVPIPHPAERPRRPDASLPAYIAVPNHNPAAGGGYLPSRHGPFDVLGDPASSEFRVSGLDRPDALTDSRLSRRRRFQQTFAAQQSNPAMPAAPSADSFAQAHDLSLSAAARQAFRLEHEPASLRDRYGRRTLGQSCLLARRLVEAGSRFVLVHDPGWDTHEQLVYRLQEGYTGGSVGKAVTLDLALSALLDDLSQRGLFDETLVLVMGEFGRTPKINSAGGRDHWPRVFSVLAAGAGIPGGQTVGRSDPRGESPADRPIRPEDLAHTFLQLLGVPPDHAFLTADGRPVVANQSGVLIPELYGADA